MSSNPYLSEIYLYPVKSLSGIKVNEWQICEKGLKYDRKWMLVDQDHRFITQRSNPEMALIKTSLTATDLILSVQNRESVSIPLDFDEGETVEVNIWKDPCSAKRISKYIDQWLEDFLHIKCSLVYQPDSAIRSVDPTYASPQDKVYFSDGFPFLLVSEASMTSLNDEMQLDLSILRFRPNLVIGGCESYAEDFWRIISIGGIDFRLPKPCSRCSIPSIDPITAEKYPEVLKTLNRLRRWNNQAYFGQNVLHNSTGTLKTGDPLIVKKIGPAQPPL